MSFYASDMGWSISYKNGWAVSVKFSESHYSEQAAGKWVSAEVAVFRPNGDFYPLTEDNDVKGWQTPEEVTQIMLWAESQPNSSGDYKMESVSY